MNPEVSTAEEEGPGKGGRVSERQLAWNGLGPGWVTIADSTFERLKKRLSPGAAVDAEAPNSPDAHWSLLLATNHVAYGFSAASSDLDWRPEGVPAR